MGQFSKVLLTIDNADTVPQDGPGKQRRLRWVNACLWAQPSHSPCLEYMC